MDTPNLDKPEPIERGLSGYGGFVLILQKFICRSTSGILEFSCTINQIAAG